MKSTGQVPAPLNSPAKSLPLGTRNEMVHPHSPEPAVVPYLRATGPDLVVPRIDLTCELVPILCLRLLSVLTGELSEFAILGICRG